MPKIESGNQRIRGGAEISLAELTISVILSHGV